MKMFGKDTSKPTKNWVIVQRNLDGKFALRRPDRFEEGEYRYLKLHGRFNGRSLHKIDLIKSIGNNEWVYRGYPTEEDVAVWTNNIRALRKLANYKETIVE